MYANNSLYIEDIKRILKFDYSFLKDKTIFITGSSGLVGSCLIDVLMYLNKALNYNIKIIATFRSETSAQKRFYDYLNDNHFNILIQNINESIKYDENIDYIIHTASNTHPALYAQNPAETIKLNVLGTLNILDFAKKYPHSKTIFTSTLEVYGENENLEKFKEDDIGYINFMKARACYPESKRVCETLCHSYKQEYNVNFNIVRLGYIYGPTVKTDSSKADVQFLNKALNSENIVMKSKGMQRRSYCYVLDTVSAILTVLYKGVSGETYNIANQNGNILLRDFAQTLAEIAGVKIIFELPTEAEKLGYSTVQNSTLDSAKLESLGWESEFTFREGIEHTYNIKREIC